MARHRIRQYALGLAVLALIPPLLWIGVVVAAPTAWAKRHVVRLLEVGSGRSVTLAGVSVPLLGGVELKGLAFGSPKSTGAPWLKTRNVRLGIGVCQLFSGRFEPQSIEVDESELRVLRRADGSLELADFIVPTTRETSSRHRDEDVSERISFAFHNSTVTVIDEPSSTLLHLLKVEGEGAVEGKRLVIRSLRGILNGGPFEFTGHLDRSGEALTLEARFRAEKVVLDDGMRLIRYAVPVLAGSSLDLKGQVDVDLYLQGKGKTWDSLSRTLGGHGLIKINPVDLDGSPVIAELAKVVDLKRQGRITSIKTDFEISNRRVTTDHFVLDVGRVPLTLSGWTDFDGNLDYRINLSGLSDRLPDKARRFLSDLNVDLQTLKVLTLQGTINQMVVQVNGISLDRDLLREAGVNIKKQDREKLRVLGRKLLDELVR
jgi:uncharacterized protein involved in outer membrane biogenesis